ncbi:Calmodulin and related proteins (EF-Hand superfamily) [Handroanthus impetiginosus]|uniref:Calmodulin and related proteins (EF-Hand superfamily) n=1 Tax=Handroanthus impetiginosus TaxID=429701 RepID=A0A2G9HTM6_9LAMI|nr:Calmodulin and related proteins (EF-Hand superfamily) [Handroanthus impetiginosus]
MKTLSLSSYFLLVLVLLAAASGAISRPLPNSSLELVSDGMDEHKEETNYSDSLISLKGAITGSSVGEESCEQMYGFVPCSKSIPGHVFLILVYEYLLFHGESYVAAGGERIFKILGPGVFGACAFQIIAGLPEALILLASGLLNSTEIAQECVLTGVGLLAGSSILLLTLVWGTCVILASQKYSSYLQSDPTSSLSDSDSTQRNSLERLFFSLWPVIPFIIIQFPRFLHLSFFWERIFLVVALVVSLAFLLAYFFHQPSIQRRQLLYLKHRHLVADVLKHLQNHSKGRLFAADGAPNLAVIKNIFEETDQDGDSSLTPAELKELLRVINFRKLYSDKDKATEDIMKEFDKDNDHKITCEEFVKGITKWIEEITKKNSPNKHHLYEIVQPLIQKRREELELMKNLIPNILEQLQASSHGSLLAEDGSPDVAAIKRLFKNFDHDDDDQISILELKDLIMDIKFGMTPQDIDDAASRIMEELDISGDQLLNEDEFVSGLSKWLKEKHMNQTPRPEERKDIDYHEKWEKTDKLVEDKVVDKSALAWIKAISLVVIGIVMLGLLAEPLIHSVHNLSNAANIPSFFIAFIFVPFATNARIAISAITEARRQKLKITSLTFSEIYGTVLMNNLLGFSVLLSLIYFRGLAWNFSIEVLMALIVSAIVGCLASFSTIFPVWTSIFAFMMYPLPLVLVNVVGDFNWLS